jgi:hypothetical protein
MRTERQIESATLRNGAISISPTKFVEQDAKTTLTIEWAPFNPTESERKIFDSGHVGMRQGWTGIFEQLTEYLVGLRNRH